MSQQTTGHPGVQPDDGVPQPVRGDPGASILGPTNVPLQRENPDLPAERVRRIGGTTIRSISHIKQLQTISDDNDEFVTPDAMIRRRILEDNRHYVELQRKAHAVCEAVGDVATPSFLEDIIDQTERRIWFLHEILQDTDRFD